MCQGCGQVHQAGENGLTIFPASTAAETTELAVCGQVRYLAVWRLLPDPAGGDDRFWQPLRRAASPRPAYLYVPAFSLVRPVVQRLGVRLTEVQPYLELTSEGPTGSGGRPALVEAGLQVAAFPGAAPGPVPISGGLSGTSAGSSPGDSTPALVGAPDFDSISPVLVGEREAWGLAHFVYLAVEAREARDLQAADMRLEPGEQELVFLPAVWDPRYIHESNWRLLLREFDGLVA